MRTDEDILRDLNDDSINDVLILIGNVLPLKGIYYSKTNNLFTIKIALTYKHRFHTYIINETTTHIDNTNNIIIDDLIIYTSNKLVHAYLLKFINNGFQLDVVSDWLLAGILK